MLSAEMVMPTVSGEVSPLVLVIETVALLPTILRSEVVAWSTVAKEEQFVVRVSLSMVLTAAGGGAGV